MHRAHIRAQLIGIDRTRLTSLTITPSDSPGIALHRSAQKICHKGESEFPWPRVVAIALWGRDGAGLAAAPQVTTRHGRVLSSYYARWIEADLSRWNTTLISRVRPGWHRAVVARSLAVAVV